MPMLEQSPSSENVPAQTTQPATYWAISLFTFCALILLSNLGGAALFEPDEGRNAEIAREVLLLKDWVTPHYDFIPRLDKPISFFDVVALSYRLFGVSEWSARLPSALAALGCLTLTYLLARSLFGPWTALWSALILLTSVEFFALSRIVIFDMLLTFFLTGALCCFFLGQRDSDRGKAKMKFLLMYLAMGAATLVKGPIGLILPVGVIVFYLFLTKQWRLIRRMELHLGIALFILTAAPWYVLVELRHPGFLQHFLWVENVARFTTARFNRGAPWYYFIGVVGVGFLPWTTLLPYTIAILRRRSLDGELRFLIAWVAVPLAFFSVSSSKLPHYILPIYSPLAVIVGVAFTRLLAKSSPQTRWLPAVAAGFFLLLSSVFSVAVIWPWILPDRVQSYVRAAFAQTPVLLIGGVVLALLLVPAAIRKRFWEKPVFLFSATCVTFALFILFVEPVLTSVSLHRSSKQLAGRALSFIHDDDQLVLFGGYPSSLPFYINAQRPLWVVWSGKNTKVLGSDYVAMRQPQPAAGYGQVLFTYDEFAARWKSSKERLLVFVDRGAAAHFEELTGSRAKTLLQLGDTVLVQSRAAGRN